MVRTEVTAASFVEQQGVDGYRRTTGEARAVEAVEHKAKFQFRRAPTMGA